MICLEKITTTICWSTILENHGNIRNTLFWWCETYPRDFVNWMKGMEQFFEQANFADNKKVRYAKLKLRGKAQRFWENLEYFRYMKYEPAINVWEDMKEKLCDEYWLPYYWAQYLPQPQCVLFKLKQIWWILILIPFHALSALLNNLSRNYLPRNYL